MENDIQLSKEKLPLPNMDHKMWNIVHTNKQFRTPALKVNKHKILSQNKQHYEKVRLCGSRAQQTLFAQAACEMKQ